MADLENFTAKLINELQVTPLHTQLKFKAKELVCNSHSDVNHLKMHIHEGLAKTGWTRRLQNEVYRQLLDRADAQSHDTVHIKEPLAYIRRAQASWEKRILKSLNSMCTELSIPVARKRPVPEQREIRSKWNELSVDEPDLSAFRPVYGPKDFLDMLTLLRNPNLASEQLCNFWGLLQIPLPVKFLKQLRHDFSEMNPRWSQVGLDDCSQPGIFDAARVRLGQKVVTADNIALCQQFSRRGIPPSLRPQLWLQIVGLRITDSDRLLYEQLKMHVFKHDLLVDKLIYKDVKLTATNDDQYFVFEDFIHQVLLLFSRDTEVLKHFARSSATPPKSYIRGMLGVNDYAVFYPPNGIIPFHGFAMYVAPLCYVFDDPVMLYYFFRRIYTRHFFRLHTISSHPQGIASVSVLFESLLQACQPQLVYHLRQMGVQPLRIAFKWLMRAFSGYLASDQLLLLWDRVLGYNSLEPLAVLAVAIFAFRRVNLLETSSYAAVEAVLADITTIKVIPLLQTILLTEH